MIKMHTFPAARKKIHTSYTQHCYCPFNATSFNIPSLLLTKKYTLLTHGRVADPSMLRLVPLIHGLVSAPSMLHGVFLAFFLFASLAVTSKHAALEGANQARESRAHACIFF